MDCINIFKKKTKHNNNNNNSNANDILQSFVKTNHFLPRPREAFIVIWHANINNNLRVKVNPVKIPFSTFMLILTNSYKV